MPGIWLQPSSATSDGFRTRFSTKSRWDYGSDVGGALSLNTPYHFEIAVTQDSLRITLNDELLYSSAKTEHALYDSMPCYASDPWYGAADVEFSNIQMSIPSSNIFGDWTKSLTTIPEGLEGAAVGFSAQTDTVWLL